MILDPLGYVPTEMALRTTIARNAFAAQPRRARRPRRHRRLVQWTAPTFSEGRPGPVRRSADGAV